MISRIVGGKSYKCQLTAIVEQLRYRNDDSGNAANVDEYKLISGREQINS